MKNDPNIDDLEKYFINTGYFIKKSTEKKRIKKDSMDRRNQRFTVTKFMKSSTKTYSNYATVNIVNEGEELEIPEEKPAKDINNLPITDRYHLDDKDDLVEMEKKTRTPKIQTKSSSRNLKAIEENNEKINYLYLKELNQETLLNLLDKQTNKDMEEYLLNQLKMIEKDGYPFTNQKLVNEIINSSKTEKSREKIAIAYKYHFECVKQFIDEIFTELLKNIDNIPYIIRAVCTIISKLIKIKFPNITTIQVIPFISEFIFSNLIIHILVNPKFNGIMMFDFLKDKSLMEMNIIIHYLILIL